MKSIVLLAFLALPVMAAAPKKPADSRYSELWQHSPFGINAEVKPTPPDDPFKDWALGGVTKFPDGYFVILLHKKNTDERLVIQPGQSSEFKILEVKDAGADYRSTTVKMMRGSAQGIVGFEEKMLTLKSFPATTPQIPRILGMPPGNVGNDRQPRLRTQLPQVNELQ